MALCLEQVFGQPLYILGISPLGFGDSRARQVIERVLEEVSIGVAAAYHVAKPKDQKQISVDTAVRRIAQVRASAGCSIFGGQRALFAKSAGGGEALTSFYHSVE